MKNLLNSRKTKITLGILASAALLLSVFGLGMAVGYRNGIFASRYGENYFHNFFGEERGGFPGMMTGMRPMPFGAHGLVGVVLDVASGTMAVRDPDNNEESVAVMDGTVIREDGATITLSAVNAGDRVTVIGKPNEAGQIEARFIRVFDDLIKF